MQNQLKQGTIHLYIYVLSLQSIFNIIELVLNNINSEETLM